MISKSGFGVPALALAGLLGSQAAALAAYPERAVRLIVGTEPGGSLDSLARVIAQALAEKWGQPVVVENKPGASATLSMDTVAHSKPDGYTLLFVSSNLTITPNYYTLNYDPIKSFAPISLVATLPEVMVVNANVPANNIADLVKLAKGQPGKLNFSSGGDGTLSYLGMIDFMTATGINIQNINYKSGASMITGLLSNETQVMLTSVPSVGGNISAGVVKALAITTKTRFSGLPDVPSVAEQAATLPEARRLAQFDEADWDGMFAPVGTPTDIVRKISADIASYAKLPETQKMLAQRGYANVANTPDEFSSFLNEDLEKYASLVKSSKANNAEPAPSAK